MRLAAPVPEQPLSVSDCVADVHFASAPLGGGLGGGFGGGEGGCGLGGGRGLGGGATYGGSGGCGGLGGGEMCDSRR